MSLISGTGIALTIREDGQHLEHAAELEHLGYNTIWLAGGQLDRLDRVREILDATRSVRVATGIVALGVFDVSEISALYSELAQRHPHRFVLGLGGPQQPHPLPSLRSYLTQLDELGVPAAERLLAALGPRKIEIARERSAGAITLLSTAADTARVRGALGAGRTLVVQQKVALDDDPERAREAARVPMRFLTQVPGYRENFVRMGFGETDIEQLSDSLVDALNVWGDVATIAERIDEQRRAGADHVAVSPFVDADVVAVGRALAPLIG